MAPLPKKHRSSSPPTPVPSMNVAQAFTGLHLHENVELADALEFFVRGYIKCAETEGIAYVPRSCTDQALTTFAHHESWAEDDGNFPWDRLDRAWKHAAMQKLIYHIRDGFSLSEQLPVPGAAMSGPAPVAGTRGRAKASIEDYEEEQEDQDKQAEPAAESLIGDRRSSGSSVATVEDDPKDPDYVYNNDEPANPFTGVKAKKQTTLPGLLAKKSQGGRRTPLPPSRSTKARRDNHKDFLWDVPSSDSDSPTGHAALRRVRKSDTTNNNNASSSSPLTSLPPSSSLLKSINNSDSRRPQTRAVTRASDRASSVWSGGASLRTLSSSPGPGRAASLRSSVAPSVRPGRGAVSKSNAKSKPQQRRPEEKSEDKVWPFDKILDSRLSKSGVDVEYRIKWAKGKPTWQPSLDLEDNSEELSEFHANFPKKVGPPEWFVKGVARGNAKKRGGGEKDGEVVMVQEGEDREEE